MISSATVSTPPVRLRFQFCRMSHQLDYLRTANRESNRASFVWTWHFTVTIAFLNLYMIAPAILFAAEVVQVVEGVPHLRLTGHFTLYRSLFINPAPWAWFFAVVAYVACSVIVSVLSRKAIYLIGIVPHLFAFPLTWVIGFWAHSEIT